MSNEDRILLTYCLQQQASGKYVCLNRNYKPVGSTTDAWVDYDKLDGIELDVQPADAAQIAWDGNPSTQRIYLYNDGCKPWEGAKHRAAYDRRIAVVDRLTQQSQRCPVPASDTATMLPA